MTINMSRVLMKILIIFSILFIASNLFAQHDSLFSKNENTNLLVSIDNGIGNTFQLNYNQKSSLYFVNAEKVHPFSINRKIDHNYGFKILIENKLSEHVALTYGLSYSNIKLSSEFKYGYILYLILEDYNTNFYYNISIKNISIPGLLRVQGKIASDIYLYLSGGIGINLINSLSSEQVYEHIDYRLPAFSYTKKEENVIEADGLPFYAMTNIGVKYKSFFLEVSYTSNFSKLREDSPDTPNKEYGRGGGYDTMHIFNFTYDFFLLNIGYSISL